MPARARLAGGLASGTRWRAQGCRVCSSRGVGAGEGQRQMRRASRFLRERCPSRHALSLSPPLTSATSAGLEKADRSASSAQGRALARTPTAWAFARPRAACTWATLVAGGSEPRAVAAASDISELSGRAVGLWVVEIGRVGRALARRDGRKRGVSSGRSVLKGNAESVFQPSLSPCAPVPRRPTCRRAQARDSPCPFLYIQRYTHTPPISLSLSLSRCQNKNPNLPPFHSLFHFSKARVEARTLFTAAASRAAPPTPASPAR